MRLISRETFFFIAIMGEFLCTSSTVILFSKIIPLQNWELWWQHWESSISSEKLSLKQDQTYGTFSSLFFWMLPFVLFCFKKASLCSMYISFLVFVWSALWSITLYSEWMLMIKWITLQRYMFISYFLLENLSFNLWDLDLVITCLTLVKNVAEPSIIYCDCRGMISIGQKRFRKASELLHNVCEILWVYKHYVTVTIFYRGVLIGLQIVRLLTFLVNLHWYFQVVTAPMSTINAIAIEAYKKYILVSLIHFGQVCFVISCLCFLCLSSSEVLF